MSRVSPSACSMHHGSFSKVPRNVTREIIYRKEYIQKLYSKSTFKKFFLKHRKWNLRSSKRCKLKASAETAFIHSFISSSKIIVCSAGCNLLFFRRVTKLYRLEVPCFDCTGLRSTYFGSFIFLFKLYNWFHLRGI